MSYPADACSTLQQNRYRPWRYPFQELRLVTRSAFPYLLAIQALVLLVAAGTWGRVWQCLCLPFLEDAAFWTAVAIAQGVVVIGFLALRIR
jgi:hypothetical protein